MRTAGEDPERSGRAMEAGEEEPAGPGDRKGGGRRRKRY